MPKRLTDNIVRNTLKEIFPKLEMLSEYINSRSKLEIRCREDGYRWITNWKTLKKHGCPVCSGNKYNLYVVRNKIKNILPNVEILSREEDYKNNKSVLKCRCKIDNYEWNSNADRLTQGKGCKECSNVKNSRTKLNIKQIQDKIIFNGKNITILSNKYGSYDDDMRFKCNDCGHEWETPLKYFKNTKGCPECIKKIRRKKSSLKIDDVKYRLNSISPTLRIISEKYTNAKSPLKIECKVCGHKWECTWTSLSGGHGCPDCNQGWYSKKRAERHKEEWLHIPAKLYLIKCNLNGEEFYKIGVTKRTMKARFKGSNMPYNIEVVKIVNASLYHVSYFESELIDIGKNIKIRHIPKIKFAGHTECFDYRIIKYYEDIERRVLNGC